MPIAPARFLPDARPDAGVLVCPIGYAPINGSATQYRIVEVNVTWAFAAADCNDDDDLGSAVSGRTHLVVVGDDAEKIALTNQFSGNTWVGLSDAEVEGTFQWVTNEPTNGYPVVGQQPPWDTGDPDGGTDENCVRFKNSFDFEDKRCTDTNSYVCECDRFAPR
ncbi:MAG: C-type lectin domain-containing protein [Deltaproteobacteria bacterium]|nr:C-type lectin domain-containing protein [Kofleriaceae bacterium]